MSGVSSWAKPRQNPSVNEKKISAIFSDRKSGKYNALLINDVLILNKNGIFFGKN
ncbi:MAG: hypothetical protein OYG32_12685 [Rhodospirillaceae bacterium]|nr:hypothetical protein [Rhodospirillaceae bacterium]